MTVSLTVNGQIWSGWTSVKIQRSLKAACSGAQFEMPGELVPQILPFMPCTIRDDGDLMLTGYIELVEPHISARSSRTTITVKSKTIDLVECHSLRLFPTTQFIDNKLDAIARAICSKYDTSVVIGTNVDIGSPLADATMGDETSFEYLERLARHCAVLLTDDEFGNLVITIASSSRAAGNLAMGSEGNIHEASGKLDGSKRFSIYRIVSQGSEAQTGAAPMLDVEGQFQDPGVPRFRPWAKTAESSLLPGGAQKRAAWEASHRLGQATKATLTIPGWRAGASNALWLTNTVAFCKVPRLGINQDLLIADVTYLFDGNGKRVVLGVAPPSAYTPEPAVPSKAGGWNSIIDVVGPNATHPL